MAVVGRSGSGKTTLLEALVSELTCRGARVACIKHTHHELEDAPGSDSARHRAAGAVLAMLAGPAGVSVWGWEPPPEQLVQWAQQSGADVVLAEGYKDGPFPRLEVVRFALSPEPILPLEQVWALATDRPRAGVRCFALDDPSALADALTGETAQA